MPFNRHVFDTLERWRNRPKRKPLILRGARQVGKTTLAREFAKRYRHNISLNLERVNDIYFFKEYKDVKVLIEALFVDYGIPSEQKANTLLFIDEIQEAPEAISMLRYFYEDIPELNVIAAGSLLEYAMGQVKNFPVGRVEFLYVHPLNFVEYLQAKGKTTVVEQINNLPVAKYAHRTLMNLFHEYAIVGGMPEVVDAYLQTGSLADLPRVYQSIWGTYKEDIEKYASNNTNARVIKHIISSAHLYIDQRIKFQHFGNSNYKSREVGEAMRSLDDARVIQLIYPTTEVTVPIRPDLKKSPRFQYLDTGLVNHGLRIQGDMLAMDDLTKSYKGAIVPHLITQELISLNENSYYKPNFWVREKTQSSSEVDIVLQHGNRIIPIEVKSGKTGKLKSLHQFVEKADHPYAVRMYAGEFAIEEHVTPIGRKPYLLMNLPYYLGTKLYEYIDYFTSEYKL